MSEKDEPGPSASSSSVFACGQCDKICKNAKGLMLHERTHSPDYADTRRPKSSATNLAKRRKGTIKQAPYQPPETKEKVTIVVENAAPDDDATQTLSSPGMKKVTILHETVDGTAEVKECITSCEEMLCDSDTISDFSYVANVDVGVADCSLLEDRDNKETQEAKGDTAHEALIENVISDVFVEPGKEEGEIFLVVDDSVEYFYTDFEDVEGDFMLTTTTVEETEWSEDPIPTDPIFQPTMGPMEALAVDLQNTIPEEWIIVTSKKFVRLTRLSQFENVCVQQSISWNGENIKIFVNNRELPSNNFVWDSVAGIDTTDCQVISEYLPKLCCLLQSSQICTGVRLYSDLWENEKNGFVENECYQEVACFRDNNCPLLEPGNKTCIPCKKLSNALKCKNWRLAQEREKDKTKVNIKHLSHEDAKTRLRETQEKKRELEKKIFKMKDRLKFYIKKNSVPVSTELGSDLAKVFSDNHNIMTPVQKLFWSEQLKCLSKQKNPKQIRWNPFIIRIALHLQMLSGTAYEYISNFIQLPSRRTLYDYSHVTEAKEGPQEHIMHDLSEKCRKECTEKHQKYFNLIFDEVDIRSGVVISRRTGEVVGYVKLSKVEEELLAVEAEISEKAAPKKQLAKKLLVYYALGITNPLAAPVAAFTTAGNFSAGQIYNRTWNVIYMLENLGIKVICLTCDGASVNKKFFKMHKNLDRSAKYIYKTNNIACGEDRPLFFITDPVHVLKSLRNNFSNSCCHKKTREMWNNGEKMSWEVIENIFYLTKKLGLQGIQLTRGHIKLTSHSCMKVRFAAQVMSLTVARAIGYCEEELKSKNLCVKEVQKFITLVNNWFDCLNGSTDTTSKRMKENDNLRPYTDENDKRFTFMTEEFLAHFDEWYKNVQNRPGKFSSEQKEKMFISMLSYESIHITTLGFIGVVKFLLAEGAPMVGARRINQDKLEQFFGVMRMAFGGNRCPETLQAVNMMSTYYLAGNAAVPPPKGNTEVSHVWVPDETPLPKRARHN